MDNNDLKSRVNAVEGWLSYAEGQCLYKLAQQCQGKGVIVEIGSWKGKSTICLALGSKNGNQTPVYAIDPHTGSPEHYLWYKTQKIWTFDEFKRNIAAAGVTDAITPIVAKSAEVAQSFDLPIELLFIDGDHSYDTVKQDLKLWTSKLIVGGKVAVHDTAGWAVWPGPLRAAWGEIFRSPNFGNIKIIDSLTIADKVEELSTKEGLFNLALGLKILLTGFTKLIVRKILS